MNASRRLLVVSLVILFAPGHALAVGDDTAKILAKYKPVIEKGLAWLVREQHKDGHWDGIGGQYPVSMTGYSSMAILAEGSTSRKGKYAENLHKAVAWLLAKQQPKGLFGSPKDPNEAGRYMMGHANALLFLSQVYVIETDADQRKKLAEALRKAVEFTAKSQTTRGGWGYVAAKEGSDFDEGCSTTMQLHSLLAARQAKVVVPKAVIDSAMKYLERSNAVSKKDSDPNKREAGMLYSLAAGGGDPRPPLTAAALAAWLHTGVDPSELFVPWLNLVQSSVPLVMNKAHRFGHDEYTHYYFAQICYCLGEDRHAQLRPDLAEAEKKRPGHKLLLKWSRYRGAVFEQIAKEQQANGSWNAGYVGEVYTAAVRLSILQLDKERVPYFKC